MKAHYTDGCGAFVITPLHVADRLRSTDVRTYLFAAAHADNATGELAVSNKRLAREMGAHRDTVAASMRRIEAAGLIVSQRTTRRDGNRGINKRTLVTQPPAQWESPIARIGREIADEKATELRAALEDMRGNHLEGENAFHDAEETPSRMPKNDRNVTRRSGLDELTTLAAREVKASSTTPTHRQPEDQLSECVSETLAALSATWDADGLTNPYRAERELRKALKAGEDPAAIVEGSNRYLRNLAHLRETSHPGRSIRGLHNWIHDRQWTRPWTTPKSEAELAVEREPLRVEAGQLSQDERERRSALEIKPFDAASLAIRGLEAEPLVKRQQIILRERSFRADNADELRAAGEWPFCAASDAVLTESTAPTLTVVSGGVAA